MRLLQDILFSGQIITGQPRAGLFWRALGLCLVGLILGAPSFAAVRTTQKRATRRTVSSSSTAHSRQRSLYSKWNPMFPGSHDLLVEQNAELDRQQLPRMSNEYDLLK